MDESRFLFMDDTFFFVPERRLFEDFVSAVCDDEEPDLEPAENVLDDVVLFEF